MITKEPNIDELIQEFVPEIEKILKNQINQINDGYEDLRFMLRYHMGWENGDNFNSGGKRIRPTLLLLSILATGGKWRNGLTAAASVELIHNFSLIHDDIEDNSEYRHGRTTLWKKWGIPQALNTGDLMFTLAQKALLDGVGDLSNEIILKSLIILQNTCMRLTKGQYLDLLFETKDVISVDDYFEMISGKTAALLSCATEIGATISGANKMEIESLGKYGYSLGMAYQAIDDILGIWGDEKVIGKSSDNDLIAKKKTLPILHALQNNTNFRKIWLEDEVNPENFILLKNLMEDAGSKDYAEEIAAKFTSDAKNALRTSIKDSLIYKPFLMLTDRLLVRNY